MTEKDLKNAVKNPIGSFLFYGEEDYLKEYYARLIKSSIFGGDESGDLGEDVLDDDSFSAQVLLDIVHSPSMFYQRRLVKAKLKSYSSISEKERKKLIEIYDLINDSSDVVLVIIVASGGLDAGSAKKPSSLFKSLSEHLKCVEFPYQNEIKLMQWLSRHFEKDGLKSSEKALNTMISLCGKDMHRLDGESNKVSAYTHSQGADTVSPEIVKKVVTETPEENAFKLANAILNKNTSEALECLALAKGRNENPISLLASVSYVLCDMTSIADLASKGAKKEEISRILNIHEYRVGLYLKAVSRVPTEKLYKAVRLCAETDLKMKSMSLGYIPLERLICTAIN